MKSKWMVATLIVALPLLLAACGIKVVVVGTPTPKPTAIPTATRTLPQTAMPEPTSTPGTTSVATPAPQASPTLPANLPTPALKINLKEVGERLWSQASFAFDYASTSGTHTRGERIQEPPSWHFRHTSEEGGVLTWSESVMIGDREWVVNKFTGGLPLLCTGWEQQPTDSTMYEACIMTLVDKGTIEWFLTGPFIRDQEAELLSGPTAIDGVLCYEYTWRDDDDNAYYAYLSAETGVPVKFEGPGGKWLFSRFNDPANVIKPLTSEMPEKLHLDDAVMALNGLSSFQYATTFIDLQEPATSIEDYAKGVYVQSVHAWVATWMDEPEEPLMEYMSTGERLLSRLPEAEATWSPVSEDDVMARLSGPFAGWVFGFHLRVGSLQPGATKTVDGTHCQEYVLTETRTDEAGRSKEVNMRLCVTDLQVPMWMEMHYTDKESTSLVITCELSHLDDPANVVEKAE